jgi:hypothetical protein
MSPSLRRIPILSQLNPVHTLTSYFLRCVLITFPLLLGLSSGLFPSAFRIKIWYVFLIYLTLATFNANILDRKRVIEMKVEHVSCVVPPYVTFTTG